MLRRIALVVSVLTVILLLGGCSSKKYYLPDNTAGTWNQRGALESSIVDVTSDGAVLQNGKIMTDRAFLHVKVPEGERFIAYSDGWVISNSRDGNITLQSEDEQYNQVIFALHKSVAAASVKDDILALLFANNEMALYSIATKELLFKEQGNAPIAVDSRIVNPYFLNDLVLFLTLDGKIVIVSSEAKKVIRSMIVSSEPYFNNIVHFNVSGNTLVAATPYKLFSLISKELRENFEVRDMFFEKDSIYICTKQGEIILLTPTLQKIASKKFEFAHFLGLIVTDEWVYALEKEGYLIVLDKNLTTFKVYEVEIDEGLVYTANKTFFVNNTFVKLP